MENIEVITLNKQNIKNFAEERNKLIRKSKSKWILFLDNDEKLDFRIQRKTYFLGDFIGDDYPVRLIKKGSGRWRRKVHEYWEPHITHNTAKSLDDYIKKINFYSSLHAKANQEENKNSNLFKIIFYPIGKFFCELVKTKHAVFAIMQAFHSYLSWSKLYFLRS